MYLKTLSLLNFKNIRQADIEFSSGLNCLTGSNGAGKTNVIDAIYYLSMCKSALTTTDTQNIIHGEEFFMLNASYAADGGRGENVVCSFKRQAGKMLKRNGKEYERLADHIGVVPVVIVSPSDVFLINDAAEERRKWLNGFISQTDRTYLEATMKYNRIMAERNKLLKQMETGTGGELLDVFDSRMAELGDIIHDKRAQAIELLQPLVADYYKTLSGDSEQVSLRYRSELNDNNLADILAASRERDIISRFSTSGIHRDDMVMEIGGYPLRRYGSQGQQKSFLIALKLAQHTIVAERTSERPILLLDDLFDKLDRDRLQQLITLTCGGNFGQIVISDCNGDRLTSVLDNCKVDYSLFEVADGVINKR